MITIEPRNLKLVTFSTEAAENIFGSLGDFESFLHEQTKSNSLYLPEFIKLFEKVKETGFKNFVDFKFEVIPDKRDQDREQ